MNSFLFGAHKMWEMGEAVIRTENVSPTVSIPHFSARLIILHHETSQMEIGMTSPVVNIHILRSRGRASVPEGRVDEAPLD